MSKEMREQIDTFKNYLNENTNNKMAHKYKLIVKWSNKPDWNITILAIDAESVTMWLPKSSGSQNMENDETYIVSVEIQLLERNVEKVKDSFIAKGID
jgi:hypothetical protein